MISRISIIYKRILVMFLITKKGFAFLHRRIDNYKFKVYVLSARTSWTEICAKTSWTKFFDNRIATTQLHEHLKQIGGVHERRQHTATDIGC